MIATVVAVIFTPIVPIYWDGLLAFRGCRPAGGRRVLSPGRVPRPCMTMTAAPRLRAHRDALAAAIALGAGRGAGRRPAWLLARSISPPSSVGRGYGAGPAARGPGGGAGDAGSSSVGRRDRRPADQRRRSRTSAGGSRGRTLGRVGHRGAQRRDRPTLATRGLDALTATARYLPQLALRDRADRRRRVPRGGFDLSALIWSC